MPNLDHVDHIAGLVYLEDDEELTPIGAWWLLETDGSAVERLIPNPIRQALIGRGRAGCDGVEIQVRMCEVVGGPFVIAVAMDAESGNQVEVATANNQRELARLLGEVLESWLFCGHDYEFAGTGAVLLP